MAELCGPGHLKRVNKLKITFLVDNSFEWFRKMPSEFTLEIHEHLRHHSPVIDEETGVPFLDLENYCCGAHGFAALIETQVDGEDAHTILFDTGPDSKSLIRNMQSMQTPPESIERVVLSHWHGDHSGGLVAFLNYRNSQRAIEKEDTPNAKHIPAVIVDLHPDRPEARGIAPRLFATSAEGVGNDKAKPNVICRLPKEPTFDELRALGAEVELHAEPHVVAGGGVYVSGTIPRVTAYEGGLPGQVRWVNNEWVAEDHVMEERYALIDVLGKGLVIFSSCSHAGIVNVVTDAVKTFQRPVYMVIGGLHLGSADLEPRIAPTVDFLSEKLRPAPMYVLPMHCSGFAVKVALESALGEGCIPAGVGIVVRVEGNADSDKFMRPPIIVD